MFYKVKAYESYIDFYPRTDNPKQVFKSGSIFEMDETLLDSRQLEKLDVVERPGPEVKEPPEENKKTEEPVKETDLFDGKEEARKRAQEKLHGKPLSGLSNQSKGPM